MIAPTVSLSRPRLGRAYLPAHPIYGLPEISSRGAAAEGVLNMLNKQSRCGVFIPTLVSQIEC